ncbi:DUF2637 domain-containing protein [Streptomyces himastatinicus]|uniref:DUF2637 domain-containing protein n=1 Tax=Streptomyces himastatinicus TaxID=998084 RepID=UPI0002FDB7BB|nr:DUF2637 domain-containing protein [Streptomyces himastatinicus]
MTPTPAPEPTNTPEGDRPTTPAAGTVNQPLTPTQKTLIGIVTGAVLTIATLGFIGSYTAVTKLAIAKGFGQFAHAFPIAVDAGIIAFLALDLLLTWRRIPYPLLRYTAWGLTAATIAFNAVVSWPDPVGVSMHGVIPVLFVIAVEAARHAVGRIAEIVADKHIEGPPASRWFLNPVGTFILWRRQRLWGIRSWDQVIDLERERRIYIGKLRKDHGRLWRRKAKADQLLVLRLARDGMSIQDAIALPEKEAQKLAEDQAKRDAETRAKTEAEAEAKHQAELRKAEVEAKRRAELAEAEAAEAEAKRRAEVASEAARLEVEAKQREDTEAARLLAAETEAKLAAIARAEQDAEAEAELKRQQRAAEQVRLQAEAARHAQQQAAAEAERRRQQDALERAQRIAARASEASASASDSASGSDAKRSGTSGSASTSGPTPRPIAPQRGKRQAEVEALLARMVEANDPKCVSLEDVMADFDLKQTTAYDRLKTAQQLYADAQNPKSAKTA